MHPTPWLLLAILMVAATRLGTSVAPPARGEELSTVTLRVAAGEAYRTRGDWVLLYRAGYYDASRPGQKAPGDQPC